MKIPSLAALAAVLAVAPLTAFAQQAGAAPAQKPEQTCPCSDYRFVAKTEKAKAVVAWWEARRKTHTATIVGTFALFSALVGQNPNGLNDAQEVMGRTEGEMLTARDKAEALHGLEVAARDADALVKVTLQPGVDYTLDR